MGILYRSLQPPYTLSHTANKTGIWPCPVPLQALNRYISHRTTFIYIPVGILATLRARAQRAPVCLGSLPRKRGCCAPPPRRPSQIRCSYGENHRKISFCKKSAKVLQLLYWFKNATSGGIVIFNYFLGQAKTKNNPLKPLLQYLIIQSSPL